MSGPQPCRALPQSQSSISNAVDSEHEFRHLAVRDFLRAHRDEADSYEALKRELARRHPEDRLAYIAVKEQYVSELEARACTWASALSRRRR